MLNLDYHFNTLGSVFFTIAISVTRATILSANIYLSNSGSSNGDTIPSETKQERETNGKLIHSKNNF